METQAYQLVVMALEERLRKLETRRFEMAAFDRLPAAMREEITQYGLHEVPNLLRMLERGDITPEMFVERIRQEARRLGIKRERPISRRRVKGEPKRRKA